MLVQGCRGWGYFKPNEVLEALGELERNPEEISEVCEKHDLIYCTDPFLLSSAIEPPVTYLGLHGKPPGEEM